MNSAPGHGLARLRLLGSPSIERDGVPLTGQVAQRHRLALLALLAAAPDHRLSRDKVLGLLWPESHGERARNLLNVAVYAIRSALGDTALTSAGDDLRLNPDVIRTDVEEFDLAVSRGDHASAVAVYTGPFLDGFFLRDTPEFEQWADRERKRLAGAYARELEALAELSERQGDFAAAAEWWRTRAVDDPYDSRVALRLMQALARGGNGAAALQHASVHERMLREEFGIAPPADLGAFAQQLRSGALEYTPPPARPAVEPAAPVGGDGAGAPPAPATPPPLAKDAPPRSRRWWFAAGTIVVAAAVLAAWLGRSTAIDRDRSIAVLPFANLSADPDNEFFSDGVTEEIITRLSTLPELKVISRTSAMHYKGSPKSARQVAEELRVTHILEGSVRTRGSRVRISAKLVNARDDRHLWAHNYDYAVEDVFRVQEEIAQQVVSALELQLGEPQLAAFARRGTRDPEAYELYRRGRYFWNSRSKEGHERALALYNRAIARDSTYADAYAGIADAYLTAFQLNLGLVPAEETYSRIKWAAERALALDPRSADAHTSAAMSLWWQKNWPGAERELRLALQLNPGLAMARSWLALLLAGSGRLDEALRESRRAYEVDPFAPIVSGNFAVLCYLTRDHKCAVEQLRKTMELGSLTPGFQARLAVTYAHMGMADSAVRVALRAVQAAPDRPELLGDLAYVQARAGQLDSARHTLARAKQRPAEPFTIAKAYVALGEPDSAFAWLERSPWQWPHRALRVDPALDPLRGDPRFAQLSLRIDREMGMR